MANMSSVSSTAASVLTLHTSVSSAIALAGIGQRVITKSWKQTANQTSKERSVILNAECITAPELEGTPFRALVESALQSAAETALRDHVNAEGDQCFEAPAELFFRPNLIEIFMGREQWLSKEALDIGFSASATWKRISSRPEFRTNAQYKKQAELFKSNILKLSGKSAQMAPEICDILMAKLEDADLQTEFGAFVVKRLGQLKQKSVDSFDLSAL